MSHKMHSMSEGTSKWRKKYCKKRWKNRQNLRSSPQTSLKHRKNNKTQKCKQATKSQKLPPKQEYLQS